MKKYIKSTLLISITFLLSCNSYEMDCKCSFTDRIMYPESYVKGESKKIQLILQIENIEGINNLDKILDLKNISGTLLGPYDLSASLGVIGKLENSLVKNAIKKYEEISKRKKIPTGIHIAYPDINKIKLAFKKKYKFIASGTDMIFLGNSCKEFLKKISNQ